MNRRSILGLLGLAPIAAPAAVRAALAHPGPGFTVLDGSAISTASIQTGKIICGSITAESIPAGSIEAWKLHPSTWRHFAIDPPFNSEDRLRGALSFGA